MSKVAHVLAGRGGKTRSMGSIPGSSPLNEAVHVWRESTSRFTCTSLSSSSSVTSSSGGAPPFARIIGRGFEATGRGSAFSHKSGSLTLRAMSWRPRQPLCPLSTLTTRPCAARTIPNISIDTTRARRRLLACTGVGATEYPLPPRQACASSSRVARRGRHGGRRPPMTARAPPRDWRAVDGTPRCMMRPAGAGRPHDHSHPCAHGPLDLCGFRPRSSW